ncbi:MAG: response regulator [Chloroflexota bacterium]
MSPKILVIDDHKETLDLVSLVLQKQGYRVSIAHSGQEGLDTASKQQPDLVLLDVMMPDMDGYTVCRKIRETPGLSSTPIILLTAKSQPDEKWEGFEAGATDYLIKPTNAEELHRRVKTILVNRKPEDDQFAQQEGGGSTVMTMSPFSRSQMTVFVGAKGGVGTTTAAINVAFANAISSGTLLADLDMAQGNIGIYLNKKDAAGLNDLAAGSPLRISGQMANNLVQIAPNLNLLGAALNIDGDLAMMNENHLPPLVEAMHSSGQSIIVDGGRGIHRGNSAALERADQIVVVTSPDRVSLASARQLIKSLNNLMLPTCILHVLLISFGASPDLPQEKVEKYLDSKIIDFVKVPSAKMSATVNGGKPLVGSDSSDPLTAQFIKLAQEVAVL